MIYLDNGATSFPKPRGMVEAMEECLLKYCGNPGRSGHYMSIKTGEEVYKARNNVARLFNIKKAERIIFTKNTTEGLNLGIKGILKAGDHVITTSMEHNSVLRPLKEMEKYEVDETIVSANNQGKVDSRLIERAIRPNTKLIVCTHASNVTGTILPIDEIGKIAERHGCVFMVDGAQSAGSVPIDVEKSKIGMLALPGHKGLLGPQGTGVLYVSPKIDIAPLMFGGTGTESKSRNQPREMPEGYEPGTINAPAIVGFGYGAEYVNKIGVDVIGSYEQTLISQFEDSVRQIDKVHLYGPKDVKDKTGISLFNIDGLSCEDVTTMLNNDYGIEVRGGYHCAGLAHKTIGTWKTGAVRLSVGMFNTKRDIEKAINAVWKMSKNN